MSNPQVDALNPATPGIPLVADKIAVYNMRSTENSDAMNASSLTEECTITGWRQNLGRFVAVASKEGMNSETFWKEALEGTVENMTMKNITSDGEQMGMMVNSTAGSATWICPEPRKISFNVNDIKFKEVMPGGKSINVSMGNLSMDDIVLPTASTMAMLMDIAVNAENLIEMPDMGEAVLDGLWAQVQNDYGTTSPFKAFTINKLSVSETPFGGQEAFLGSMDTLGMTLKTGSPFDMSMAVNGMRLDPTAVEPALVEAGLQDATYDFAMGMSLAPQPTPTVIRMSAGSPSLGTSEFSTELILPINTLSDLFTIDEQVLADATQIKSAHVDYTDKGLMGISVAVTAIDSGVAPAALYHGIMQQVNAYLPMFTNPATRELADKLIPFLEKPGTVKLSLEPVVPLNTQALLTLLMAQQIETLGITLDVELGPKTLLETIPPALMK